MILDKLIDGKALTPIEDVPEAWNYIGHFDEEEEAAGIKRYQCKRMSSLFKKNIQMVLLLIAIAIENVE